jgi:methyl-accepting chemotaxis protein
VSFGNLKIATRIGVGFTFICIVLLVIVGLTQWNLARIDHASNVIIKLRVPTAAASAKMVSNINESLAALRGYMITGKAGFKQQRAVVWADIAAQADAMDRLSANWTNADNVAAWTDFKTVLAEFSTAQDRVEAVAFTIDEQPATKILVQDAAPQASIIVNKITEMIEIEKELAATPSRKALVTMMADYRGSMGLGMANIRAYLLTGDAKFRKEFDRFWQINEARFGTLSGTLDLLIPEQAAAFADLSKARANFAPLPPRMFEIRGSEAWNVANHLLLTEAAPRAAKLLTVLAGEKSADGIRRGGMVENQEKLLATDAEHSADDIAFLSLEVWILLGVGLVFALSFGAVVTRSVTKPVGEITHSMGGLTDGDLETEVTGQERGDEVGDMARAVQIFKESLIENKRLEEIQGTHARDAEARQLEEETRQREEQNRLDAEAEREAHAAEESRQAALQKRVVEEIGSGLGALVRGDLSYRVTMEMPPEYETLKSNFNQTGERLSGIVGEISQVVSGVNGAAGDINSATGDLGERTENQASNLEETAAAMEEMLATVSQNAKNTDQTHSLITKTRGEAEKSGDVVKQANEAMLDIEKSSKEIAEIIGVIDEIAFQTNLLALNAAVEAARAGDAGKGFAVVATEVRTLAQRSSVAAKEIKTLISQSGDRVETGVNLVNAASESLVGITTAINEVSKIMGEIASAGREQATGLEEVNGAVSQMDTMTQQNAAMVEENTAAARSLLDETSRLVELMSFFKSAREAGARPIVSPLIAPVLPSSAPIELVSAPAASSGAGGKWDEF